MPSSSPATVGPLIIDSSNHWSKWLTTWALEAAERLLVVQSCFWTMSQVSLENTCRCSCLLPSRDLRGTNTNFGDSILTTSTTPAAFHSCFFSAQKHKRYQQLKSVRGRVWDAQKRTFIRWAVCKYVRHCCRFVLNMCLRIWMYKVSGKRSTDPLFNIYFLVSSARSFPYVFGFITLGEIHLGNYGTGPGALGIISAVWCVTRFVCITNCRAFIHRYNT